MNRAPVDLLDELVTFESGVFPLEALAEIIDRREEFADPLLDALQDILKHPMEMVDEDTFFPIHAIISRFAACPS